MQVQTIIMVFFIILISTKLRGEFEGQCETLKFIDSVVLKIVNYEKESRKKAYGETKHTLEDSDYNSKPSCCPVSETRKNQKICNIQKRLHFPLDLTSIQVVS